MNYPILSLVFGFIFLTFTVFIVLNLTTSNPTIQPQIENTLTSVTTSIERFCLDPFTITSFSFTTNTNYELFVENQDICISYQEILLCERIQCVMISKTLTSEQYIKDRDFFCQMTRLDNLINIECQ